MLQVVEYFLGCQVVQSRHALSHIAFHGESLARTSLTVGEAGYFGPLKRAVDEGSDGLLVNLFVVGLFIEGVVEVKSGLFDVFCEINFLSW